MIVVQNPLDYRSQFKESTKHPGQKIGRRQQEIRIELTLHLLTGEDFSIIQQVILADMMKNDKQVCKVVELYC